MTELLQCYKEELENELKEILSFWIHHCIDHDNGGFIGRLSHTNQPDATADKGCVLNSRILWAFSAAARTGGGEDNLACANTAYHYFIQHFVDSIHGGVFWSVDYQGRPRDTHKQVYAQAFAIYALSEFVRATNSSDAKQAAIDIYQRIEATSFDKMYTGYIDAFTQDWKTLDDMSLSEKDANEKKTMNTHLHVLEAYTNLYRIWPEQQLASKIRGLLQNFDEYIIDADTGHMILFFDEAWQRRSDIVSYGHDIEAAWLLHEAAEAIGDAYWIARTKAIALQMAAAAKEGLDKDGGLWYEYLPSSHELIKEKHWWPQAEAMVGFFNAWQVSGDNAWLQLSVLSWNFTKRYMLDKRYGEWVWGVYEDYSVMNDKDKAGMWKCPYHNGRACMEIIHRIATLSLRESNNHG